MRIQCTVVAAQIPALGKYYYRKVVEAESSRRLCCITPLLHYKGSVSNFRKPP